jgi:trehalose 6-phosphate phosphatase
MIQTISLPVPGRTAFLLDFDGTLVDIAPTPDEVVVPPDLVGHLRAVCGACGGALAIVSGRPIAQIDALLGGAHFAMAGEHGTALRAAPGGAIEHLKMPDPPAHWVVEASSLLARYPGALFEPKRYGFVLHYRAVPEAGAALGEALAALVAEWPEGFCLLPAKMAWEIRPVGTDKGSAVRALMAHAPFAGRLPVFLGDDVTDEDGLREAVAQGGLALRVPDFFGDAAGVRAWIAGLAATQAGDAGWLG